MERRLAAILVADMVGYSRLIGEDEAGTLQRLKADRAEQIDPAIARHGGMIIRLAGDGALVEFPSVVEAVQCAVDIQRGMAERNAKRPETEQIVFRMGVNLGDIVIEDDNLHGEGINIAARLEAMAPAGGILTTEEVARHVDGKVTAALAFVGERSVKNIERPVRVYQVQPADSASRSRARRSKRRWPRYATAVGVVAVALIVALRPSIYSQQPAPQDTATDPSLIVLPFRNLSDDESQDYFVDGVTEDLITDLSRLNGLFVISRNTSFAYQDRGITASELAQELGVRYALKGSVRRQGTRIRVSAQLVDATTDRQIWGERYDRELTDVFAVQDDVKQEIVAALSVQFDVSESEVLSHRRTKSIEAYELYLRGRQARHQGELRSMRLAYWTLEKAIELEPDFASALALLADIYALDYTGVTHPLDWERPPMITRFAAEEFAHRAQTLDPAIAGPQIALAHLRLAELRYQDALLHAQRAVALEPGLSETHVVLTRSLSALGRHQEASSAVDEAFRLDPRGTTSQYAARGMALFGLGDYAAAHESFWTAQAAAATVSLNWKDAALMVAAAGFAGRPSELISSSGRYVDAVQHFLPLPIFARAEDGERLLEGLRLGGVPEYSGDRIDQATRPLDNAEIESLLFGRSTASFCHGLEYSPALRISTDGRAIWDIRYDISEAGEARVEEGRLCMRFPVISRARDLCFRIYPNDPPAPFSKNHSHVMDGPLLCFFTPQHGTPVRWSSP